MSNNWLRENPWVIYLIAVFASALTFAVCECLSNRTKKTKKRQSLVDPSAAGVLEDAESAKAIAEMSKILPDEDRSKIWAEIWSRIQKASEEGHTYIQVADKLYSKIPYDMLISTLKAQGYVAESCTIKGSFPEDYYQKGYQLYISWGERSDIYV